MAYIKIKLDAALMDGHNVTFKAPCDCTAIEGLKVCYIENNSLKEKVFSMKDTHGNALAGLGNLFAAGAYVHAILDSVNLIAYLQNAATNGYLEGKLKAAEAAIAADHARIEELVNNQIPEEYLQACVEDYINNNDAGLATKEEITNLSSEIEEASSNYKGIVDNNILVGTNYTYGIYIGNTGVQGNNVEWCCSDFVEVEAGKTYYIHNVGTVFVAFYDANKNMVKATSVSTVYFTVDSDNIKYVRISVEIVKKPYMKLTLTDNYFIYGIDSYENLIDNSLFDKIFFTYGCFINRDGVITTNAEWCYSEHLNVVGGKTYYLQNVGQVFVNYYDSNKNHIKGEVAKTEFVTPSNAVYMIVSVEIVKSTRLKITDTRNYTIYGKKTTSVSDEETNNVITVGVDGDFEDLREAVEYAYSKGNVEVKLLSGEHVITDFSGKGLPLGNNIKIKGNPKAKVIAHYMGGVASIERDFAVFNALNGDYELNGVIIDAKNTRYCIHDERGGSAEAYHHIYKNCNFYLDNSGSSWANRFCIGGGLGQCGTIDIENCVFESVEIGSPIGTVSFHNNSQENSKSLINVTGCYFKGDNGTFRASYYGSSTDITECYVSNCNMGIAPILEAETGSSTIQNVSITAWNNEVRS